MSIPKRKIKEEFYSSKRQRDLLAVTETTTVKEYIEIDNQKAYWQGRMDMCFLLLRGDI